MRPSFPQFTGRGGFPSVKKSEASTEDSKGNKVGLGPRWLRSAVMSSWFLIVFCFVVALVLAATFLGTLALIVIAFVAEPGRSIVAILIIAALIAIFRP